MKETLQTGLPDRTFKRGHLHPTVAGRVFSQYVRQCNSVYESWVTESKLNELRVKERARSKRRHDYTNPQTGSARGHFARGDKHPDLDLRLWTYSGVIEWWVDNEGWKKQRQMERDKAAQRRSTDGIIHGSKVAVELYEFRDILNRIHKSIVFHVDHIVPLSKGGAHSESNLQLATASYNLRKGAKLPWLM